MSQYEKYAENPTGFLSMTGYTRTEFDALLPYFNTHFLERMKSYCLDGKPRQKRGYSDYKNSPLPTIFDKLFFILTYLKTNNLQTIQGACFGMSQPKANQWIHTLHSVLNQSLASLEELPARQIETVVFAANESLYFHDGTERPIPRPVDAIQQREFYSGKKNSMD